MPFENKHKEINENGGSQRQGSREMSLSERLFKAQQRIHQQRLQSMLNDTETGPSSSGNERLNSARAAVERNGRTAPGSEVLLTGRGALGGTPEDAQRYLNHEISSEQREAYSHYTARVQQLSIHGFTYEHASDIAADEHPTGREVYLEYRRLHSRAEEHQNANASLDAQVYLNQISPQEREAYSRYNNRQNYLQRQGYSYEHASDIAADEHPTGREVYLEYQRRYRAGRRTRLD